MYFINMSNVLSKQIDHHSNDILVHKTNNV